MGPHDSGRSQVRLVEVESRDGPLLAGAAFQPIPNDADADADAARRGIGMHGHGLARRRWTKYSRGDSLRMGLDMRVVLASRRA